MNFVSNLPLLLHSLPHKKRLEIIEKLQYQLFFPKKSQKLEVDWGVWGAKPPASLKKVKTPSEKKQKNWITFLAIARPPGRLGGWGLACALPPGLARFWKPQTHTHKHQKTINNYDFFNLFPDIPIYFRGDFFRSCFFQIFGKIPDLLSGGPTSGRS